MSDDERLLLVLIARCVAALARDSQVNAPTTDIYALIRKMPNPAVDEPQP